ncbi:MAG TPA: OmpA family protein [Burkholderiaceae bacterium]|nr:OmpA family protein [Burkholderiaceae bacterium]
MRPATDLLPWALLSIAALVMTGAAADALHKTAATDPQAFEAKACEGAPDACAASKAAPRRYVLAAAFALDSAELPSELMRPLDAVAAALRERPAHAVRVEVHTDASGPPEARRTLTQRRADAVKAYLVEHGVDAAVLHAVGMGSSVPRPGRDPYAAANRRIEVVRL